MARPSNESTANLLGESACELADVLLETYSVNEAMNQLLLAHLDPRAWRAEPPGARGSGRTIAATFAHLHNRRLVWLKNSAPHLKCLNQGRSILIVAPASKLRRPIGRAPRLGRLGVFRKRLTRLWRWALRRRSQTHRPTWALINKLVERWLPRPRALHPYPSVRFAASHLR